MRFRSHDPQPPVGSLDDSLAVGQMIDALIQPGSFFSTAPLSIVAARAETIPWEIFRGRLVPPTQTRQTRTFLAWSLFGEDASEPLLSVKFDLRDRAVHIVRALLTYAWTAIDNAGGIESTETIAWSRELVGSVALADVANLGELRDEIACLVWQAFVGTSRLPLTSVEAPLPDYVLGQSHFIASTIGEPTEQPIADWRQLLEYARNQPLAWMDRVKLIEFLLRRLPTNELPALCDAIPADWSIPRLLRSLFNHVSLSPYTQLVDNTLTWLDVLRRHETITATEQIDFHCWLLRHLCRHLTAYDLITFHHRGANYPDALALDAILRANLQAAESNTSLFLANDDASRLRRRAVRQACMLRRHYEGHLVPEAPTSPGENARVMPAAFPRLPDEQFLQSHRRRKQLYAGVPLSDLLTPIGRTILSASLEDLAHPLERIEQGIGLFIDRPLGYAKALAEPDLTPLLAHEAFSGSLVRRRGQELADLAEVLKLPVSPASSLQAVLKNEATPGGLPHTELADCPRPTIALTDVRKVADDFIIARTLPVGLRELLSLAGISAIARLAVNTRNPSGQPVLTLFDENLQRMLELQFDPAQGYRTRAGVEWPRSGVQVVG
ncbi:MAG: hypothetical protein EXS16_13825 [Gemmataceae bacterium]|nr:hypothetical protein [Gemmataceae bacterium]